MFHSVSVTSLLGVLLTLIATAPACLGQGTLDDLRGDVRTDTP
jgi:hypothetical protein